MTGALIIGASGQDGRLLTERLEQRGEPCVGLGRGDLDLGDRARVAARIRQLQPRAVYYLAAHHQAAEQAGGGDTAALLSSSLDVQVTGLVHVLEAIREHVPAARLFYAASSHVFGAGGPGLQDEQTPCAPTCVYGITKTAGWHCCRHYRSAHGVRVSVGILYNHESAHRGPNFVSQKIVRAALAIAAGHRQRLVLGDLAAGVDWGYAPDYVEAMRLILALPQPEDFVVATGERHTVQEFAEIAFGAVGLDWRDHVDERPGPHALQRRALAGDASRLRAATGWRPSVSFAQMVGTLIEAQRRG
jgi:GDPmannose 4,6-dehydratase